MSCVTVNLDNSSISINGEQCSLVSTWGFIVPSAKGRFWSCGCRLCPNTGSLELNELAAVVPLLVLEGTSDDVLGLEFCEKYCCSSLLSSSVKAS